MVKGDWKFNAAVARSFQEIAQKNIPNYEIVIKRCVEIVSGEFPDKDSKIIDVGSALGHTMQCFRRAGYKNTYGVDSSQSMLRNSKVRQNLILSDEFPKSYAPFDVVIANWTLHFIKEKKRKSYLRDIYESLHKDGILILSEKMKGSDVSLRGYMDFKRSQGLSERAIAKKTASVQGVLVPLPMQWYLKTLAEIGFTSIETIDARWCFNTIMCRK